MRILQIHSPYRQRGGEDLVVEREKSLLVDAGHDVAQYLAPNPVGGAGLATALAGSAWNSIERRRVRAEIDRYGPDIAHVHNTWFSLSPAVLDAASHRRVPVVFTLHNFRLVCVNGLLFRQGAPCETCVGKSLVSGVRFGCYRDSRAASALVAGSVTLHRMLGTWHQDVDVYLALTEFARLRFIAGGIPAEKIRVKPHFVPDPGSRPEAPSSSNTVLFVGRLSPEKGLSALFDAWERFRSTRFSLVVIGDGPSKAQLAERAPANVRLLGSLPPEQVADHMLRARALVFPSIWYETFGLTMVEAMAAGLPVLASRLGGSEEILAGLPSTALVEPGSLSAWLAALDGLDDDTWVDRCGMLAREAYEARYTPDIGLRNLEATYQSVFGRRS